ncbi:MAG: ABC transporter permease, partial [Candidatus Caldatribacterium sp.]|nr:ABC transporter permease [Candidatus Caldatribacterium sp.]
MIRLVFRIALRFLLTSRTQTLLILLGITAGVAIQIFLSSLIAGLQANLIERTVGDAPHIIVTPRVQEPTSIIEEKGVLVLSTSGSPTEEEAKILSWQPTQTKLAKREDIVAASPLVEGPGSIRKGELVRSIVLRGILFDRADRIYELREKTIEGIPKVGGNAILVGKELAADLRLLPGDIVRIVTPQGNEGTFIVNGVFDLENATLNRTWVFLDVVPAWNLLNLEGAISSIEIQIADVFEAERIASDIKRDIPQYPVETWQQRNAQLLSALRSQSLSSYLIQVFILIAVTLGIASVLVVSVTQRIREIGILKAIGITNLGIGLVFLVQGGILGLLGSSSGAAFGLLLVRFFQQVAQRSG